MNDLTMAGPPSMSRAAFVTELALSPAHAEAGAMFDTLVTEGIRPELALAFFFVESKYGTKGVAHDYQTRSIGNVRTPEDPALASGVVQVPGKGRYARYPTWANGTLDWCKRLKGPKYAGAGLLTVRQVLPKYAPSHDANNPDAYADTVIGMAREFGVREGEATVKEPQIIDLRGELPTRPGGGSGKTMAAIRGQVLHYSAVNYPRDRDMLDILRSEALYHIDTDRPNALKEAGLAYHYCVDPYTGAIYQTRDEWESLWHCGYWGTPGNGDGLAIHVPGGSTLRMEPVAVQALCWLLGRNEQRFGFVRAMLKGHRELSETTCPGPLMGQIVHPYRAGALRYAGTVGRIPIIEEAQVREPAPDTAETYINDKGEPITAINWGGRATKILGTNFRDVGVSLVGADGQTEYDRSLQDGAMRPYAIRPKG